MNDRVRKRQSPISNPADGGRDVLRRFGSMEITTEIIEPFARLFRWLGATKQFRRVTKPFPAFA
jgi:hypothetical protein